MKFSSSLLLLFFIPVFSLSAGPAFFLGTDRSFGVNETANINLEGPANVSYDVRVYRVENPNSFLKKHLENRRVEHKEDSGRGNPIALLKKSADLFKNDFQAIARKELNTKTRSHLKKTLAVNTEAPQRTLNLAIPSLLPEHTYLYSTTLPAEEKYWDYRRIPVSLNDPGFYLVEVVQGNNIAHTVVIKSNIQFLTKQSDNETLVFAAAKDSGNPLENVNISVFDGSSGREIKSGSTSPEGMLYHSGPSPAKSLILAVKNGQYAMSDPDFYAKSFYGEGGLRAYLYTDRPVYRPGGKVKFKGIVRNFIHSGYQVVSGSGTVDVVAETGEVEMSGIPVNISGNNGTFSGELNLPAGDNLHRGIYSLILNYRDLQFSTEFSVESYKKPPFSVSVKSDKKIYYAKDKIQIDITGRYYHGTSVAGAKVQARVFRSPRYSYSMVGTIPFLTESMSYLGYGDVSPKKELVVEKNETLNSDGKLSFSVTPEKIDQDYIYSVTATVSDPSVTLTGGSSFSVNRGLFYLNIIRENTVCSPGDTVRMKAEIVPFDRSLTAEQKANIISGVNVTAVVYERKFVNISGETKEVKTDKQTSTSNAKGVAEFSFSIPKNGHYSIEFNANDRDGNELSANTTFWSSSVSDSISVPFQNLVMKTGKDVYTPGETAEILIFSPVKDASLFLSVEGNRLLKYETVHMSGNVYKYKIPLKQEMTPNFSVSAVLFSRGDIYKNDIKVIVPPGNKFIQVNLAPDKAVYRPGETVQLKVSTSDSAGRPVPAEVSVSVVDEAIFQIQPDRNPPAGTYFYHPRRNNIQTTLSSAFRFFGYAETKRLRLALLDKNSSFVLSVKDAEDVRSDFEDTAYWNPRIQTAQDGKASVSFRVPDNLTTWKIKAVAVTSSTQVGEGKSQFVSRKDLMIDSGFPEYMIRGREQTVSAKITNLTGKAIQTGVNISVQNASIVGKSSYESVSLQPGENKHFYFKLKISDSDLTEVVTVKLKASGGQLSDSMEKKIPLRSYGIKRTENLSFALDGSDKATGKFSTSASAKKESLVIRLSPGYGEALRQSLSYLAGYPYGCIEQTMSRFMPLMAAKKSGYISDSLQSQLPEMVKTGLEKIEQNQNSDGGFGWFGDSRKSDPIMTAYVYRGLIIAKKLDQTIDAGILTRSRKFLYTALQNENYSPTARAYILFSLSEAGAVEKSLTDRLADMSSAQTPYGTALTSLVLHAANDPRAADFYKSAYKKSSAYKNPSALFEVSANLENDEVELTSALLTAALRMNRPGDEIDRLSSALLFNRNGEGWKNSRDTAMAVLALSERMEQIRDRSGSASVTLSVDGKEIFTKSVSSEEIHAGGFVIEVPGESYTEKSSIQIQKSGGPPVHAAAGLAYFDTSESFAEENRGISIARKYMKMSSGGMFSGNSFSGSDASSFARGDLIMVVLDVRKNNNADRYFMVEDPIPPGFSFVKNDSVFYSSENAVEYDSRQIFDDRAAFFHSGPSDHFTVRYFLTADLPGQYSALPGKASLMYYPGIYGITGDTRLQITE